MAVVSSTIRSVTSKDVEIKRGPRAGQSGTVYMVETEDGQSYDTWDDALAQKAHDLVGEAVDLQVEQRGNFYNLQGVRPAQNGSGTFPPARPAAPQQTQIPQAQPQAQQGPSRDERIERMAALKEARPAADFLLQTGVVSISNLTEYEHLVHHLTDAMVRVLERTVDETVDDIPFG
jgi:hypothetical protein